MKKTVGHKTRIFLGRVTLHLEDIEQIYQIMSESLDEVSLSTGEYSLDGPDEIPKLRRDVINHLEFVGYHKQSPAIFLYVHPKSISIHIWKTEPIYLGIGEQLRNVLKQRERTLSGQRSFLVACGVWLVSLLAYLLDRFLGNPIANQWLSVESLSIGLLLCSGLWLLYARVLSHNRVVPDYRAASPSFLKRNLDKIVVAAISSAVGLLLGYAFGRVTGTIP